MGDELIKGVNFVGTLELLFAHFRCRILIIRTPVGLFDGYVRKLSSLWMELDAI